MPVNNNIYSQKWLADKAADSLPLCFTPYQGCRKALMSGGGGNIEDFSIQINSEHSQFLWRSYKK